MQTNSAKDDETGRERLSALADGELHGQEFAEAVAYGGLPQGQESWRLYHMVGEALRGSLGVHASSPALLERLREQIAHEAPPRAGLLTPAQLTQVAPATAVDNAANASVWRWKLAASLASLIAVVALGSNVYVAGRAQGGATAATQQLAAVRPALTATPRQQTVAVAGGRAGTSQVMIRDPRLDELLAAHQQFDATTVLQTPAGFLRNASFEAATGH